MVSKGKKDMSKEFKSGDKARIVGNVSDHSFQLGEIVLLEEWDDNGWVALHLDRSDHWYVEKDDLEGIGDEGVKKNSNTDYNNVSKPAHYNHKVDYVNGDGINSDGGPSAYYDFHEGWRTWNDFADYKARQQWKEHSFHLGNVGKVLCRWGDKSGTSKSYDARKIVYSGLRVLLMLEGKENVRAYLENLLEDNQFKD